MDFICYGSICWALGFLLLRKNLMRSNQRKQSVKQNDNMLDKWEIYMCNCMPVCVSVLGVLEVKFHLGWSILFWVVYKL